MSTKAKLNGLDFDGDETMAFTVIIDGHNFINDLKRNGWAKEDIKNKLSLPILANVIQRKLKENGLKSHPYMSTEFICSDKDKIGDFSGKERDELLNKFRRERGITVILVKKEVKSKNCDNERDKGVDMTVFSMMLERGYPNNHHVVLIASDTDYIPALGTLKRYGIHTVLVAYNTENRPLKTEMINQAYLFLDLDQLLKEMKDISESQEP